MELRTDRRHVMIPIEHTKVTERLMSLTERPIDRLEFHREIDLTAGAGAVIKGLVEMLSKGLTMDGRPLTKSPIALANLSEAILMMLLEDTLHSCSQELAKPPPAPAPWHVKRAMDFMQANLAKPITIEDVARVCNVNIRTLQQGFRQFRKTTPKALLQKMRLEAAHRHLCMARPERTVADVALMWGFTHLGRFAIEYKKLYGKRPSETLRKK